MDQAPGNATWRRIGPKPVQAVAPDAIARAFDAPELGALLPASGGGPLVVVNDPTRSTATCATLDHLADWLSERSRGGAVDLLVATGTHRFDARARADHEAWLRGSRARIGAIAWHDARATDGVSLDGRSFDAVLARATHVLAIGSVEPHYFAGVTGPHKTLTVGCLSHADIEHNHAHALSVGVAPLALEGNPVHQDCAAALAVLGRGRVLRTVSHVAVGGRVLAAAAGDPLAVTLALAATARDVFEHVVDRPVDVAWLRVPSPLGQSLYQADKAIKNHEHVVRDGGAILLEAGCDQGVGPDAFLRLLRGTTSHAALLEAIARDGYRLGDHKAALLRRLLDPAVRGVRLAVASPHLDARALEGTGIGVFADPEQALAWLEAGQGSLARRLCVDDAAMTISTLASRTR